MDPDEVLVGQQTPEDGSQGADGTQQTPEENQIPEGAPEFDGNGRTIYYNDPEYPDGYVDNTEDPVQPPPARTAPAVQQQPTYTPPQQQVQTTAQQPNTQTQPNVQPNVQIGPAPPYWDAATYLSQNKERLNELSLMDPIAYNIEIQNAYVNQEKTKQAITRHQMGAVRQQVPELFDRHADAINESLEMLTPTDRREPSAVLFAVKRAEGLEVQRLMSTGMSFRDATIQVSEQTLAALKGRPTQAPRTQPVQTQINQNAPRGTQVGGGAGGGSVATGSRTAPKKVGLPGFQLTAEEDRKIKAAFGRSR